MSSRSGRLATQAYEAPACYPARNPLDHLRFCVNCCANLAPVESAARDGNIPVAAEVEECVV